MASVISNELLNNCMTPFNLNFDFKETMPAKLINMVKVIFILRYKKIGQLISVFTS